MLFNLPEPHLYRGLSIKVNKFPQSQLQLRNINCCLLLAFGQQGKTEPIFYVDYVADFVVICTNFMELSNGQGVGRCGHTGKTTTRTSTTATNQLYNLFYYSYFDLINFHIKLLCFLYDQINWSINFFFYSELYRISNSGEYILCVFYELNPINNSNEWMIEISA